MPETAHLPDQQPRVLQTAAPSNLGPSREEVLFYIGELDRAEVKLTLAKDERKKVRQAATRKGIKLELIDEVRYLATLEPENLQARELERKRYFDFVAPGTQFEIDFNQPKGETNLQKAQRRGYELGVAGEEPDEQAYPPMDSLGVEHREAWERGHIKYKELFKIHSDDMAKPEAPKKRGRPPKPVNADETLNKVKAQAEKKGRGRKKNGGTSQV